MILEVRMTVQFEADDERLRKDLPCSLRGKNEKLAVFLKLGYRPHHPVYIVYAGWESWELESNILTSGIASFLPVVLWDKRKSCVMKWGEFNIIEEGQGH